MAIPAWLQPSFYFEYARLSRIAPKLSAPRMEKRHWRMWMKVVDVYDGDTITVACIHRGVIVRWRCRLVGFDAPEMRSQNADEKVAAIAAKRFLMTLLPAHTFRGKCAGLDKYGRLLLKLEHKGVAIEQIMILNNHGYAYEGKTKQAFHAPDGISQAKVRIGR